MRRPDGQQVGFERARAVTAETAAAGSWHSAIIDVPELEGDCRRSLTLYIEIESFFWFKRTGKSQRDTR
jgi:hypothetical protein